MADLPAKEQIESWVNEARRGVDEALGQLFGHYRDYLLLVANKEIRSGVRPKVAASDVVQNTLLDAHVGFSGFRGRSEVEVRTWLRQILLNNIRDTRRQYTSVAKRDVRREQSLDDDFPRQDQSPYGHPGSPADLATLNEEFESLQAVLSRLPSEQRAVIVMRSLEQRSFSEIAAQMDRSPNAVRMIWARTIERIRDELNTADE